MVGEILRESNKTMEHFIFIVHLPIETSGGFHKWGYPQMDGLSWKIRTIKIDDFGYTYFRKLHLARGFPIAMCVIARGYHPIIIKSHEPSNEIQFRINDVRKATTNHPCFDACTSYGKSGYYLLWLYPLLN
jgi:hypothetical protein